MHNFLTWEEYIDSLRTYAAKKYGIVLVIRGESIELHDISGVSYYRKASFKESLDYYNLHKDDDYSYYEDFDMLVYDMVLECASGLEDLIYEKYILQ